MSADTARSARTPEQSDTEIRQGARALLATPILTAGRHPHELALVRTHAPALKAIFTATVGYQLVVESTFARLHKGPLSTHTAPRAALRTNGAPFAPRTYTYLALLCAGLLSPPARDQVLISALVAQVRTDAVNAEIPMEDTPTERRHLVHAMLHLIDLGVLTETDGTVAGWRDRHAEALLDVARPLLPHLLTSSLADLPGPQTLLDGTAARTGAPESPRRSLRRKLVENPLVRREDLSEAERDALSRERTELARVLDETFGLTLEVRLEGALAYDVAEELTDVAFPGQGTVARVALLLTGALADDLKVTSAVSATLDGAVVPGALAGWDLVDDAVALLIEQYGDTFGAAHVADPGALTRAVVELLKSLSLARATSAGLLLHPACARYRPEPFRPPPRHLDARAPDSAPDTLFGDLDPAAPPPAAPDNQPET